MTLKERKLFKMIYGFSRKIDKQIRIMFDEDVYTAVSVQRKLIIINPNEFFYEMDDEFEQIKVFNEKGMDFDILLPTIILLHEIAHIGSLENVINKRKLIDQELRRTQNLLKRKYTLLEQLRFYKKLPLENKADSLACVYYFQFNDEVKEFDRSLRKLLNES